VGTDAVGSGDGVGDGDVTGLLAARVAAGELAGGDVAGWRVAGGVVGLLGGVGDVDFGVSVGGWVGFGRSDGDTLGDSIFDGGVISGLIDGVDADGDLVDAAGVELAGDVSGVGVAVRLRRTCCSVITWG
jgi:hypothetical protein